MSTRTHLAWPIVISAIAAIAVLAQPSRAQAQPETNDAAAMRAANPDIDTEAPPFSVEVQCERTMRAELLDRRIVRSRRLMRNGWGWMATATVGFSLTWFLMGHVGPGYVDCPGPCGDPLEGLIVGTMVLSAPLGIGIILLAAGLRRHRTLHRELAGQVALTANGLGVRF